MLSKETFISIVRNTPLVSIDLIISRDDDSILLGHRLNEPARGFWFVPGGRIYKDETLADAFSRISHDELGLELSLNDAKLKGGYEHFYTENFAQEPEISTHYVVLAYQVKLHDKLTRLPDRQHDDYQWFTRKDIENNPDVHENTRAYFL